MAGGEGEGNKFVFHFLIERAYHTFGEVIDHLTQNRMLGAQTTYTCYLGTLQTHAAAVKSLQSCPTLCDPIDGSHQAPRPWDSPGKNKALVSRIRQKNRNTGTQSGKEEVKLSLCAAM